MSRINDIGMIDLRGGAVQIEVDRDTVWVNVDGVCRLRVQGASAVAFFSKEHGEADPFACESILWDGKK